MSSRQNGPLPLARLVKGTLDPLIAKRGFGAADLIASWDEVVGPRYAACTEPEKISWPRQREGRGILTIRVDGPAAIYLQHERAQIIERINGFLGRDTIGDLRIVQKPRAPKPNGAEPRALALAEQEDVARSVAAVEDDRLKAALTKLGEAIAHAPPREGLNAAPVNAATIPCRSSHGWGRYGREAELLRTVVRISVCFWRTEREV